MATRTSSPPRKRPSGSQARKKPAARNSSKGRKPATRRPAQRRPAPKSGPGPLTTALTAILRAFRTIWLGIAGLIGAVARSIGHSAKELEPEQRRDGIGLTLLGLGIIVAAAVWWQLPGSIGDLVRAVVAGSVGLVAWFVPLLRVVRVT